MLALFANAIITLAAIGALLALSLHFANKKWRTPTIDIVEQIDLLLPQTQCGECGYMGCKPYAAAMANGEAINRCPPGGEATISALADFFNIEPLPLDGITKPPAVAFIREEECIGCTKCIQACPVDAIVGAAKLMHTVIADECTGCDLCVESCPVDCIEMRPLVLQENSGIREPAITAHYRQRFIAHTTRLQREAIEIEQKRQTRRKAVDSKATTSITAKSKQDEIREAIARAKAKKAAAQNDGAQ